MILSNKGLNINKLEEIYKQKKIEENRGLNTHNQGVTDSSPVGPTLKIKKEEVTSNVFFLFFYAV